MVARLITGAMIDELDRIDTGNWFERPTALEDVNRRLRLCERHGLAESATGLSDGWRAWRLTPRGMASVDMRTLREQKDARTSASEVPGQVPAGEASLPRLRSPNATAKAYRRRLRRRHRA